MSVNLRQVAFGASASSPPRFLAPSASKARPTKYSGSSRWRCKSDLRASEAQCDSSRKSRGCCGYSRTLSSCRHRYGLLLGRWIFPLSADPWLVESGAEIFSWAGRGSLQRGRFWTISTPAPARAVSFSNFSCAKILNEKIHVLIGHSSIQLSILLIVE